MTRRQQATAGLLLALIAASIVLLDRPVAEWLHLQLYNSSTYRIAEMLLRPLDAIAILIAIVVLARALLRRGRRGASAWLDRAGIAGQAALLSLLVAVVLKAAIGRSQVYPTFLRDHLYTFRPFGAWPAYGAFPSATTAFSFAFVVALRPQHIAMRAVAALVPSGIALAILVTNGHWLSDLLAGALLGAAIGRSWSRRQG